MNIFDYYNSSTANQALGLPMNFIRYLKSIPVHCSTSSRSRTFSNVIYNTLHPFQYDWYPGSSTTKLNIYNVLNACCSVLFAKVNNTSPKAIQFKALYLSSDEINSRTLDDILNYTRSSNRLLNFTVYYTPKNRTALNEKIKNADIQRLPQIETILISGISHYVRVLKTDEDNIVVFTNLVSEKLISLLYTLIPKILNIKELQNPNDNEEVTKLNQIIQLVLHLHEIAYDSTYEDLCTQDQREGFKDTLLELSALCVDTNALCNDFITNFANRRNNAYSRSLENRETTCLRSIDDYEKRLTKLYEDLGDIQHQRLVLKQIKPDDVKPFIDAIKNNPQIEILDSTQTKLTLRITAPLQYYDAEDYLAYENNPSSKIYQIFSLEERSLFHDVFINKKYGILLQAIINLELVDYDSSSTINFNARTNCAADLTEFPNPHLYYFNCWSEAKTVLAKAVANNDYEIIVPQLIATVQSVNVAEGASFVSHFLSDLATSGWQDKMHFIEHATQTKYTFESLLAKYKAPAVITDQETPEHTEDTVTQNNQYTQIVLSENDEDEGDE